MYLFCTAALRRWFRCKRAPTEIFFRIYDTASSYPCHPGRLVCWCTSASLNGMQHISQSARPARSSNERRPPLSRMQIISVFIAPGLEEKDELPTNANGIPSCSGHFKN